MKRLFTEEQVDFAGTYYTVTKAECPPTVMQQPHPPFLIRASAYRGIGTLEEIGSHIRKVRDEVGVTYFCLRGPDVEKLGPVIRELAGYGVSQGTR